MSVLDRNALVDSPLADLHTIASELSIDGYRRLRRDDLIDAILAKQGSSDADGDAGSAAVAEPSGEPEASAEPEASSEPEPSAEPAASTDADGAAESDESGSRRRRGRRGGRGRGAAREEAESGDDAGGADEAEEKPARAPRRARAEKSEKPEKAERAVRSERSERADRAERPEKAAKPERADRAERSERSERPDRAERSERAPVATEEDEPVVAGVVELLANGSGFVRVNGPDPSDDDVYISSAQVKRCELVSGDTIAGPKRAPRRSERFASLIRIETINGRPASELADSVRFDDLPSALPTDRLTVGSDDPTLKAIEWLTPFGLGSRVTIVGAARAGKSEALRRLAAAFADREEMTLTVALAGVRPEEISEWTRDSGLSVTPTAAVSFGASEDAQNGAVEPVIDQARRLAARGAHAVVLIDTLDGLSPQMARKAMASARNLVDGGSVTVIATASQPVGGETTVISLDVGLTSIGRFPALDLLASGTLRPELLVGEAGAEAIARTRADVAEGGEG